MPNNRSNISLACCCCLRLAGGDNPADDFHTYAIEWQEGEIRWGAQEFQHALFLRYVLYPPDLPKLCDGCNTAFSICHDLDCKKGVLVTARYNELRDRVTDLADKAFTQTHVSDDPFIFAGRAVQRTKVQPARSTQPPPKKKPEAMEQKGNLLICDLWKNGTDSVHNMRVVNTEAKYNLTKTPEKCLQEIERVK